MGLKCLACIASAPQAITAAHGAAVALGPRLGRYDGRMPAELPAHLLPVLAATAARAAAHLGAAPPLAARVVERTLLHHGAEAAAAARAAAACFAAASLSYEPEQIERAVGAALHSPCSSRQPPLPPELTGEEPYAASSRRRPRSRSSSPLPATFAIDRSVSQESRSCFPLAERCASNSPGTGPAKAVHVATPQNSLVSLRTFLGVKNLVKNSKSARGKPDLTHGEKPGEKPGETTVRNLVKKTVDSSGKLKEH